MLCLKPVTYNLKTSNFISIYSNEHSLLSYYQTLAKMRLSISIFLIDHTNIQLYIINITYMYTPTKAILKTHLFEQKL